MVLKHTITRALHGRKEEAGFTVRRPRGIDESIFLFFYTPMELTLGGTYMETPPNTFVLIPPNMAHEYRRKGEGCFVNDYLHIQGDMEELLAEFQIASGRPYALHSQFEFISHLVRDMEQELSFKEERSQEAGEALLYLLLLRLSRLIHGKKERYRVDSKTVEKFQALRTQVNNTLEQGWTRERMAETLYVSCSTFSILYKKIFGVSPKEDLTAMQVDKAKFLLETSALSITAVAAACGYSNVYNFIRQFKKAAGLTPKQYALQKGKA